MLEEDVLVGGKLVHRFAEGIGDGQRGRARTAIVHAGVAVARDPQAQVERALTAHSEAQIGGHDGVVRRSGGLDFDGSAVEREQQRRGHRDGAILGNVELGALADAHRAAAAERDGRGVILGGDAD
jgi:hypothetical protein